MGYIPGYDTGDDVPCWYGMYVASSTDDIRGIYPGTTQAHSTALHAEFAAARASLDGDITIPPHPVTDGILSAGVSRRLGLPDS